MTVTGEAVAFALRELRRELETEANARPAAERWSGTRRAEADALDRIVASSSLTDRLAEKLSIL